MSFGRDGTVTNNSSSSLHRSNVARRSYSKTFTDTKPPFDFNDEIVLKASDQVVPLIQFDASIFNITKDR